MPSKLRWHGHLTYCNLIVAELQNHAAKGITDKDFYLLRMNSMVGQEENNFEGIPSDEIAKFVKTLL